MAAKKPDKGMDIAVDIHVPPGVTPQPANHFTVSYADEDFGLDVVYVHPLDLHIARKNAAQGEPRVRGTMVARLAFSYRHATELRAKLDEMIKSYEAHKK